MSDEEGCWLGLLVLVVGCALVVFLYGVVVIVFRSAFGILLPFAVP